MARENEQPFLKTKMTSDCRQFIIKSLCNACLPILYHLSNCMYNDWFTPNYLCTARGRGVSRRTPSSSHCSLGWIASTTAWFSRLSSSKQRSVKIACSRKSRYVDKWRNSGGDNQGFLTRISLINNAQVHDYFNAPAISCPVLHCFTTVT